MFAIISDRGRQHLVKQGDKIFIDRMEAEPGSKITFDRVLMLGGEGSPRIGQPTLAGVSVSAEVVAHKRGPKIHVQTYKRRKNYKRHIGHRQDMTEISVTTITV
jgi:large subunit ribosomal protein L21